QGHETKRTLEEAREIGDLHPVQTAVEQRSKRQNPATLLMHCHDNLVYPELPDGLLERARLRDDTLWSNYDFLHLVEREEADELACRIRRRERRLHQTGFRPGPEHQNAMRAHVSDEREHDHMPQKKEAAEGEYRCEGEILFEARSPRNESRHD